MGGKTSFLKRLRNAGPDGRQSHLLQQGKNTGKLFPNHRAQMPTPWAQTDLHAVGLRVVGSNRGLTTFNSRTIRFSSCVEMATGGEGKGGIFHAHLIAVVLRDMPGGP